VFTAELGYVTLCMKFIVAHAVYLQRLRVKLEYEGHLVKVKVTGAKKGRKFLFLQCRPSISN